MIYENKYLVAGVRIYFLGNIHKFLYARARNGIR